MKRIAILTAALLLSGCTSFGQLGLLCYIPPDHSGMCQLVPKTPVNVQVVNPAAPAASGVSA